MRHPLLLAILLGLGPLAAHAQSPLSGRVLDRQTGQPVPYASVVVAGTTAGTTSNADGEFALTVRQLPAKLLAFSLGYGRDSAVVATPGPALTLRLLPAPIQLPAAEPPSYAAQLLAQAYRVVQRTRGHASYGQAFYRQVTRNGAEATEVLEAVWDVKASSAGVEGSRLAQGRYASRPVMLNFENFSLYTKVFGGFCGVSAADTADIRSVVGPNPDQRFLLHYQGVTQNGPYRLAEIAYENRPGHRFVRGSVFIDLSSYQVLHARATRVLELKFSKPGYGFRESYVTQEADFKPSSAGALPNYVKTTTVVGITQPKGKPDTEARAESLTYFFGLGPVPTGLPYAGPDAPIGDLAAIRRKAYDPAYWRDNPVVKRTPLEDEIMRSFENQKAFGTMLSK